VGVVALRRTHDNKLDKDFRAAELAEGEIAADTEADNFAGVSLKGEQAKKSFERYVALDKWTFEEADQWGKLFPEDCALEGKQSPIDFAIVPASLTTSAKVEPIPVAKLGNKLDKSVLEGVYKQLSKTPLSRGEIKKWCELTDQDTLKCPDVDTSSAITEAEEEEETQKSAKNLKEATGDKAADQEEAVQESAKNLKTVTGDHAVSKDLAELSEESAEQLRTLTGDDLTQTAAKRSASTTVPRAPNTFVAPWSVFNGQLVGAIGHYSELGYIEVSGKRFSPNMAIVKSPSEHTVAGEHYDGEVQFVFAPEGSKSEENMAAKEREPLLGISVFLGGPLKLEEVEIRGGQNAAAVPRAGPQIATAVEGIAKSNPTFLSGDQQQVSQEIGSVSDFLSGDGIILEDLHLRSLFEAATKSGYYSYLGTLTVPPCISNVHWLVGREPVAVDATTLQLIKQKAKSRPTQPLGSRNVTLSTLPAFSSANMAFAAIAMFLPLLNM